MLFMWALQGHDGPLVCFYFEKNISLDSSYELSAKQMIHMKDLFSQKNENFRLLSAANFAWHFKG